MREASPFMAHARRDRPPNPALARLIEEAGISHHALAARIRTLARQAGLDTAYTHTSVSNWTRRGVVPRRPLPVIIAAALAESLGRAVDPAEIGMPDLATGTADVGLDFPRETPDAVRAAAQYWSTVNLVRRELLAGAFAIGAYTTPMIRWLGRPADQAAAHQGQKHVGHVGHADLAELWEAAEQAQAWDSKYGGGTWRSSSVTDCLTRRAVPLLHGTYSDEVGRSLFSAAAELARVAAWSAVDTGHHNMAQRHFIQALRMAKAAGNVECGTHIVANMALQALLRGFPSEAVDMAQGAYDRGRGAHAAPRVLGFVKLVEARAHALLRDARAADSALSVSERCLENPGRDQAPLWISYFTHARLSADATEVHRDLSNPAAAWRWNAQAAMPEGIFTRSVGLRMTVLATTHVQQGDLDAGIDMGNRSIDVLSRVASARARDYVGHIITAMSPWQRDPRVAELTRRARTELSAAR